MSFFFVKKQIIKKDTWTLYRYLFCPDPESNRGYNLRRIVSYPLNDQSIVFKISVFVLGNRIRKSSYSSLL